MQKCSKINGFQLSLKGVYLFFKDKLIYIIDGADSLKNGRLQKLTKNTFNCNKGGKACKTIKY